MCLNLCDLNFINTKKKNNRNLYKVKKNKVFYQYRLYNIFDHLDVIFSRKCLYNLNHINHVIEKSLKIR